MPARHSDSAVECLLEAVDETTRISHWRDRTSDHENTKARKSGNAAVPGFHAPRRVAGATSTGTRDVVTVRHRRADMRYAHRVH